MTKAILILLALVIEAQIAIADDIKYYTTTTTIVDQMIDPKTKESLSNLGSLVRTGTVMDFKDGSQKTYTFGWTNLYVGDGVAFVNSSEQIKSSLNGAQNIDLNLAGFIQKNGKVTPNSQSYSFVRTTAADGASVDHDLAGVMTLTRKSRTLDDGTMLFSALEEWNQAITNNPVAARTMMTERTPVAQKEFLNGASVAVKLFVLNLIDKHTATLKARTDLDSCLAKGQPSSCTSFNTKYQAADTARHEYLMNGLTVTDVIPMQPTQGLGDDDDGGDGGYSPRPRRHCVVDKHTGAVTCF